MNEEIVFCTAEDRDECDIGLKLLSLSLEKHCPGASLILFHRRPSRSLDTWLKTRSNVVLRPWTLRGSGWDCKPDALLQLLEEGHGRVVWVDTDIMFGRDPRGMFNRPEMKEALVVAQEPVSVGSQGTDCRVLAWKEQVGRSFPITLNSCVIHATNAHRDLLMRWRDLLNDERYTRWFSVPQTERPWHAKGDQDVLNVVAGSKGFESTPVLPLRSGIDVIHSGGALYFGPLDRLKYLLGSRPYFVHAIAMKPWTLLDPGSSLQGRYWTYRKLAQELSVYVAEARSYRALTDDPCAWLDYRSTLGAALNGAGMGNHALSGLPLALFATAAKAVSSGRD